MGPLRVMGTVGVGASCRTYLGVKAQEEVMGGMRVGQGSRWAPERMMPLSSYLRCDQSSCHDRKILAVMVLRGRRFWLGQSISI